MGTKREQKTAGPRVSLRLKCLVLARTRRCAADSLSTQIVVRASTSCRAHPASGSRLFPVASEADDDDGRPQDEVGGGGVCPCVSELDPLPGQTCGPEQLMRPDPCPLFGIGANWRQG